ncbi:bifunctional 2-keto-4-hydroxyglutarate aldolase/2-keto-3-deoxy-6-phosphogluconate aldolase [Jeotgalibacillus terrae]|uniref:Bifunctional 2-keto-4-hydroxyglutarate aldolase/2-keto-3-deoxy-6-phosphogluconate aldolase n=1 Tax=Jeotgalibacillus terrae TaxID=587735 RepID=A0ABW5ZKX3_9BACL|nr:bifunctional 2-keto-4-hydroxyglutarate aldolase/2-keto-3-deoxy-6-phosphogluconate aldolase [Jeotgalibacillus terrae]MBM7579647.1 2-dehydro-3-deoxyphosphogluconate aldolase/(4S)-4-hydroxy-2-oxoglutarate aldolase [Jeotgalibacillus terrae]
MKKMRAFEQLLDAKLTVVIRGSSSEEAVKTAEACLEGGIRSLEFTFTNPEADKAIKHFADNKNIIVGAGSVIDSETAKLAVHAGALFIVGPHFSMEVAKFCNRYQVPYLPGCMTVKEILDALEMGVSIIKLFPGEMFSPSFIKAVKGPVPQVDVMPTGGVTLSNVKDWFENGAIHVGVGGGITKDAVNGNYEAVVVKAREFMQAVSEVSI